MVKKKIKKHLLKAMNLWPPFLGAGIRVQSFSEDFRTVEVELKLRKWNKNYVGTQYGGSLYSMCDPFYMLMLLENLGSEYIVWDKAATIKFRKPGKGTVKAKFHLSEEDILSIKKQLESAPKCEPVFKINITDSHGVVIAEVEKLLYVKKKSN